MTVAASTLSLLVSAWRSSTPMAFVLGGEVMGQRAGIVNVGVEGQMLVGAAAGFAVALHTDSYWLGLLGGSAAGLVLSLVHGALCLVRRANQITSGVAVFIVGSGLSSYFGASYVGRQLAGSGAEIPALVPAWAGSLLGQATPAMFIGLAVPLVLGLFLYRTRLGLNWRAVGESTAIARSLGLRPGAYRWAAILLGGLLSGFGGASLSVDDARSWSEGMTAGRGLVAVGLVIMTRWNPLLTTPVALIFGAAETLSLTLQTQGVHISPYLLETLPYLIPLAFLAVDARFGRNLAKMPASLQDILLTSN
jgi:simple sugar transport system permease protein